MQPEIEGCCYATGESRHCSQLGAVLPAGGTPEAGLCAPDCGKGDVFMQYPTIRSSGVQLPTALTAIRAHNPPGGHALQESLLLGNLLSLNLHFCCSPVSEQPLRSSGKLVEGSAQAEDGARGSRHDTHSHTRIFSTKRTPGSLLLA